LELAVARPNEQGRTGRRRRAATAWQLADAKARFSELFERALETPQRVSRHGKDEGVILSARAYDRIAAPQRRTGSLVDFPAKLHFGELDLDRDQSFTRDIPL
jgi:prevent-host-death family protein